MKQNAIESARSTWLRRTLPGLLVTFCLAAAAFLAWWLLKATWLKFSALLWAFIFSIIAANISTALADRRFVEGISLVSTRLLRISIALLGLTFSAAVWLRLGIPGVLAVLLNLALVFVFSLVFCRYCLKLNITLAILLGMGTSVCGASAIAATGPAVKARAEEMGLSVAVITLFGLLAMLLYPLLYAGLLNGWLGGTPAAYGMWTGMGIHETAQVIAAGSQVEGAGSVAISAKFIRIFMIGPMVFTSLFALKRLSGSGVARNVKIAVPWFAVAFIALTFVNLAFESLPFKNWWSYFNSTYVSPGVTFLLAWAFAGVGLQVKIASIRKIGMKAFIGGIFIAVTAGASSLLLVKFLWLPFSG